MKKKSKNGFKKLYTAEEVLELLEEDAEQRSGTANGTAN